MTTPEALARQNIDAQLTACGWVVQNRAGMNLYAGRGVAVREFPLDTGFADYLLFVDRRTTKQTCPTRMCWRARLSRIWRRRWSSSRGSSRSWAGKRRADMFYLVPQLPLWNAFPSLCLAKCVRSLRPGKIVPLRLTGEPGGEIGLFPMAYGLARAGNPRGLLEVQLPPRRLGISSNDSA